MPGDERPDDRETRRGFGEDLAVPLDGPLSRSDAGINHREIGKVRRVCEKLTWGDVVGACCGPDHPAQFRDRNCIDSLDQRLDAGPSLRLVLSQRA